MLCRMLVYAHSHRLTLVYLYAKHSTVLNSMASGQGGTPDGLDRSH